MPASTDGRSATPRPVADETGVLRGYTHVPGLPIDEIYLPPGTSRLHRLPAGVTQRRGGSAVPSCGGRRLLNRQFACYASVPRLSPVAEHDGQAAHGIVQAAAGYFECAEHRRSRVQ